MTIINKKPIFFFLAIISLFSTAIAQNKIKIACVGNSITFGYLLKPGENYPAQLQILLGDQYEVTNFGLSGRTLLKKGDRPYWNETQYKAVLELNPDVVVIKLGTNDTKPQNWKYKDEFIGDYTDFINSFKQLPSHPKIYICTPFPIFANKFNIRDSIAAADIVPDIKIIAKQNRVNIIDLYSMFAGQSNLLVDGVHPNKHGAVLLAQKIYEAIK